MTHNKPIALWAVPRSISTAFERVFVERDDFEVFHEPFGDSYYYGEDRLSDRYSDLEPKGEYNYQNVLATILESPAQRVFVKDMAYHAKGLIGPGLVSRFRNTFIVRDPKYVISSLHRMWPDFTLEETGFEQLYHLFRYAMEADPEDVVVIDAMTFSENPVGILATYCEHLEIPFRSDSLSWQPREVRRWENWEGWHEAAQQSTGIKPAERKDPALPPELQEAYDYCLPYYHQLAAKAIPGTVRAQPRADVSDARSRREVDPSAEQASNGPSKERLSQRITAPVVDRNSKRRTMLAESNAIAPHGGQLVDLTLPAEERHERLREAAELPKIPLEPRALSDLQMISTGVFSPVEGFMLQEDYTSVVEEMRLSNGLAWSMPVTLAVDEDTAQTLREGSEAALVTGGGEPVATILLRQRYRYDKKLEAQEVYRTTDAEHPGVAALYRQGDVLLGGEVELIQPLDRGPFPQHYYKPEELRALLAEKGWKRVVGFQTRNPVHRAHEYIQKSALETVDGLLLNPLVGETKSDDIPADVRMRYYEKILNSYYPKDRTMLAVFPAAMRYAGPREAIFHAICRKNYGCTHFIVGRDHAGVGSYYGTYDAQHVFEEFAPEELGITPLFFEHAFFCRDCQNMASSKTCPHDPSSHVFFSGTKVREMLSKGEYPPPEFSRPEVIEVLMEGLREG